LFNVGVVVVLVVVVMGRLAEVAVAEGAGIVKNLLLLLPLLILMLWVLAVQPQHKARMELRVEQQHLELRY
jgi:hypothetical protein